MLAALLVRHFMDQYLTGKYLLSPILSANLTTDVLEEDLLVL